MTLDRERILDLLPLFAGGDLDPAERASVAEGLERFPELRSQLEDFERLDGLLARSLPRLESAPPAWLSLMERSAPATTTPATTTPATTTPATTGAPLVRRHCPYCKDDLAKEARVFCAECLTPHHEGCFSEHNGCSLLGCGSTRAIAAADSASKVCPACSKQTPETAPFCAWCGHALVAGQEARPRHEAVRVALPPTLTRRQEWTRFAASVAVLLAGGLVVGGLFAHKNNLLLEEVWTRCARMQRQDLESRVSKALLVLARAEEYYRQHGLGGDDRYAETLEELETKILAPDVWPRAQQVVLGAHPVASESDFRALVTTRLSRYEVKIHALVWSLKPHFWITATPVRGIGVDEGEIAGFGPLPTYFVNHSGHGLGPEVVTLRPGEAIPKDLACPDCSDHGTSPSDHNEALDEKDTQHGKDKR